MCTYHTMQLVVCSLVLKQVQGSSSGIQARQQMPLLMNPFLSFYLHTRACVRECMWHVCVQTLSVELWSLCLQGKRSIYSFNLGMCPKYFLNLQFVEFENMELSNKSKRQQTGLRTYINLFSKHFLIYFIHYIQKLSKINLNDTYNTEIQFFFICQYIHLQDQCINDLDLYTLNILQELS